MKIAICTSMSFSKEIMDIKNQLEKMGHVCFIPEGVELYINNIIKKVGGSEGAKRKIENNLIRKHYNLIKDSDCILVLNYEKRGIKNYIGGNSFLEMGFAHILGKTIFLLNQIPEIEMIKQEIEAMQPIVINGNLNLIMEEKFLKIKEEVEKELSCSAHNMDHIMRVYNTALRLAENENVNLEVLKAAALLHDIARVKEDNDSTGNTDHAIISSEISVIILKNLGFSEEKIKHIQDCILSHRYRTNNEPKTKEAQILFDADKLDTTGATGIARAFVWVGRNNANIYKKANTNEYINDNLGGQMNGRIQNKTKHSPQIEYETKSKFLCDKFYTEKGRQICRERMDYYKRFLDRLEKEIRGEI